MKHEGTFCGLTLERGILGGAMLGVSPYATGPEFTVTFPLDWLPPDCFPFRFLFLGG